MDYKYPTPSNEVDFERFCRDLLRVHWPGSNPQRWGRRGQKQHGVDIVDMNAVEPLRGGQSKFKKPGVILSATEVETEVEESKRFDLNGLKLGRYTILTTSENATEVQGKVLELNREHRRQGLFTIELLTWEAIEEILRENPGLWDSIFGRSLKPLVEPLESGITAVRQDMSHVRMAVEALAGGAENEFQARLEAVRSRLDSHEYQEALLLLRGIRNNHWHALTEPQRFLTLTYSARVAYSEGKWLEAAKLFMQAEQHLPDDERAKTNRALGLELAGERREAHALARQLAREYPGSVRPWSIICRTADDDIAAEQLEAELPTQAKSDDEVLVALAMRAAQDEKWATAERFAAQTAREDADWAVPWIILAQCRRQQSLRSAYKPAEGPAVLENVEALRAVVPLFDKAIAIAERTRCRFLLVQALVERGRTKGVLGDEDAARADIVEAYNQGGNDPVAVFHYGQYLFSRGQPEPAIPLLRRAVSLGGGADAGFVLALAIRDQKEEGWREESLALATHAAMDRNCSYRFAAVELALAGSLEDQNPERAAEFLKKLTDSQIPDAIIRACEAWLAFAAGDRASAMQSTNEALARLRDEDVSNCRFVGEVLHRLGDHARALPIWERVVAQSRQITDLWRLFDAADRLDRPDIIRRVAREWRAAGIRDQRLIDEELHILERYEPQHAVGRLQEELALTPDDPYLLLRLSALGLRLGRPELVCRDAARLPSPDEIEPQNGGLVIQSLAGVGELEQALRYAYRLLRFHPGHAHAHAAFTWLLLVNRIPGELIAAPERACPGAAVAYIEQGETDVHWLVLEDDLEGTGFGDEVPSDHAIIEQIKGKTVGDTFLISGDEADGRAARIESLTSKHTYRLNRILDEWQVRFHGQPGFAKFRLEGLEGGDARLPDFTPILRRVHQWRRHVERLLELYRHELMPIHMLSEAIGAHFTDAFRHLAESDDQFIRCCSGGSVHLQRARTSLTAASAFVLDLSAISTLWLLRLEEQLAGWPAPLIVSVGTFTELLRLRDEHCAQGDGGHLVPTNSGIGLQVVNSDPAAEQARREAIEHLIKLVRAHTDIRDCGELTELPPEQRERLTKLLGVGGAEGVVLASPPGHVLWTDDAVAALAAHQELRVRRIWSQVALEHAVAAGVLTEQEWYEASAQLMGYNYQSTQFSAPVLIAACRLADWNPGEWPLTQALRCLSQADDPHASLGIAGLLIRQLFLAPVLHPGQEQVALTVLDRLAEGPLGTAGVKALRRLLPRLFAFNVVAENAAETLMARWLAIRGED